ncbi:MAG: hypothetical protein PHQ86_06920 [Dehalococcoidales bacterium]|nr:hypothetical protein [Dehalococcoidales bacterium]
MEKRNETLKCGECGREYGKFAEILVCSCGDHFHFECAIKHLLHKHDIDFADGVIHNNKVIPSGTTVPSSESKYLFNRGINLKDE